ncbi:MAG: hypothetical protein BRD57_03170 [Proteobacteria bacterium SW_6_67_9]|nr:MAG: hypothetical protein BRD57_03170 [Proteobacteria bacterium SW_6_67_9]
MRLLAQNTVVLAQSDHAERIGDLLEPLGQALQDVGAPLLAMHVDLDRIANTREIIADALADHFEQAPVGPLEIGLGPASGQELFELIRLFDLADSRAIRARAGDVIEQIAQQIQRDGLLQRRLALADKLAEQALDARHQYLDVGVLLEPLIGQRLGQGAADMPEALRRRARRRIGELVQNSAQLIQARLDVVVAVPAQQGTLESRAQPRGPADRLEPRLKDVALGQRSLAACTTQLIDQG